MRSLSLKMALLVGILGLLQAIAVAGFSYATMSRSLADQKRHLLRGKLNEARVIMDREPSAAALGGAAFRLADMLVGHQDMYIAIAQSASSVAGRGVHGQVTPLVAFSSIAVESLQRLKTDTWGSDAFLDWRTQDNKTPMLSVTSASEVMNGDNYILVLSADRTTDEGLLSRFLFTALTAAPFALALVSLGALVIVNIGLKPVNRFREAAITISTKNMSGRIDPTKLPTELLPLCDAFNSMLDRLDDGIRRLSQFSGDIAHEMRTPLATLLGRTQVTLSQPRTQEQLLDVLESNMEELEHLSRLVTDMLFLAQAESTTAVLDRQLLELSKVTQTVIDFMQVLADDRHMSFHQSGEAQVIGDAALIKRAITNLISNAVRYGDPNSVIDIAIRVVGVTAELSVTNTGTTIAPEHHSRLFDRFYRIDHGRSRNEGGTGLGLAIVKTIMVLHGGSVTVGSQCGQVTRFTLSFPQPIHRKGQATSDSAEAY